MQPVLIKNDPLQTSARNKTLCEFFAGIGLVGEGLKRSGWNCVYANDNDPRKRELYEAFNGLSPQYHLEDIYQTEKVVARIPGVPFLATASFPCIDMSLAGHYRGFEGEHSSTFFAFAKVLHELGERRPRVVMLENVLGFVASRQGEDFKTAARVLADLGYWLDAFHVDARHFVPQSRPRVFVLGMHASVLPPRSVKRSGRLLPALVPDGLRPARLVEIMHTVPLATGWFTLDLPNPPVRRIRLVDVIDLDDEQGWWAAAEVERHYRMMSDLHREQIDGLIADGVNYVGTVFRRIRKGSQRAEVRFDGLAGCLRTPKGGSAKQIVIATQGGRLRMRWMSPREYARLQGVNHFPVTNGTRNQLLWGFGDAVCVPVVEWIDSCVLTPIYDASNCRRAIDHGEEFVSSTPQPCDKGR